MLLELWRTSIVKGGTAALRVAQEGGFPLWKRLVVTKRSIQRFLLPRNRACNVGTVCPGPSQANHHTFREVRSLSFERFL